MPTISIFHQDFQQLLGQAATVEDLDRWLPLAKGELKDHDPSTGEIRIELQDSNRPDLWCVEGITRQIRLSFDRPASSYSFFSSKPRPKRRISVSPGMEKVRPFVAACTSTGYQMTEEGLAQFIQTQEKLADIYGHKRKTVSIGLYRLNPIQFPVTYGLVKPQEARFVPLGVDEKMTLSEILHVHPKGIEYGSILSDHQEFPLLWDKEGQVLSFPPIINSRDIGGVQVGDTELLVEVTGLDLHMVLLTLNIFAVNLADRGATIEPLEIVYSTPTALGKTLRTPMDISQLHRVSIHSIESALGQPLGSDTIQHALVKYGYEAKASRNKLAVRLPAYRNDLMHPIDVAEDVAISRGYESFSPMMPAQFTVGSLSPIETASDYLRDLMVGFGFQEMFSNILTSQEEIVDRMQVTGTEFGQIVEVDNIMSQNFSCLRSWLIPSLLKVEGTSGRAFYPHRIFELGEAAIPDLGEDLGSRTLTKLAGLIAYQTASFSEMHTFLDLLLYYWVRDYSLEPISHPSFLNGRVGKIMLGGSEAGIIGEIHPQVLEAWQINMPVSVFELDVNSLLERD
jgi:phenylalanyl-tRNA synthetase beta chain